MAIGRVYYRLTAPENPRYTGAFVYGRTRQRKVAIGGQLRYRRLKREEWSVFLPNMYPGYISWEEFESNKAKLLANANGYGEDRRKSPPREGAALLQALAICGVCSLRMTVRYHTDHGHPIPDYVCQRRGIQNAEPLCQRLPGVHIDQAVTELVLKAVNILHLPLTMNTRLRSPLLDPLVAALAAVGVSAIKSGRVRDVFSFNFVARLNRAP